MNSTSVTASPSPSVTEADAVALRSLLGRVSPGEETQIRGVLQRYEQQEITAGRTPFADTIRTQQEQARTLKGYFTLPDHGLGDRLKAFESPLRNTPDPEAAKWEVFNSRYVGQLLGVNPREISGRLPGYMQGIAERQWGHVGKIGHKEFAKKVRESYELSDTLAAKALEGATRGLPWVASMGGALEELQQHPGWRPEKKDIYMMQFAQMARAKTEQLAPYRATIASAISDLKASMGVTDGAPSEDQSSLAARIMDIPSRDRDAVLQAIMLSGAPEGEDRKAYVQKLGERLWRGSYSFATGLPNAATRTSLMSMLGNIDSVRIPEGEKDPVRYILAESMRPVMTAVAGGDVQGGGLADAISGLAEKRRPLTDEEKTAARASIGKALDTMETVRRLNEIATQTIDPATSGNIVARGVLGFAESIPMIAGSFVPGGQLFIGGQFAEDNYYQLRRDFPDMDRGLAQAVSLAAAPVQAFTEVGLNRAIAGRFPNLERISKLPITTWGGMAKRSAIGATSGVAGELLEETAQDIAPYVIMEAVGALGQDVPDVPWGDIAKGLDANKWELFWTILPGVLTMSGTANLLDFAQGRAIAQDERLLRAAGLSPESALAVTEAAKAGDWDKAQTLMRAEWTAGRVETDGAKLEAVRTEAAGQQRQEAAIKEAAVAQAEASGIIPPIRQTATDNFRLELESGPMDFPTRQAAEEARWSIPDNQMEQVHAGVREALQLAERNLPIGEAFRVERTGAVVTTDVESMPETTPEEIAAKEAARKRFNRRSEIEDATEMDGGAAEEQTYQAAANVVDATGTTAERHAVRAVLGESFDEFKDGVLTAVARLHKGFTPLTVVEETVERAARRILAGEGGRSLILEGVRDVERKTGDRYFKTDDDAKLEDGDFIEAFSKLAVGFFVGESRAKNPDLKANREWLVRMARTAARAARQSKLGRVVDALGLMFDRIFKRAKRVMELRRRGEFHAGLEKELAQALGLEQRQHEAAVVQEAQEMAAAVVDGRSEPSFSLGPAIKQMEELTGVSLSGVSIASEEGMSDDGTRRGNIITVKAALDESEKAGVVAHEVFHLLHEESGDGGYTDDHDWKPSAKDSPELKAVWEIASKSRGHKELRKLRNSKDKNIAKHARTLTEPRELLARVVEQYVTAKNGGEPSPVWKGIYAKLNLYSWLQQDELGAIVPHVEAYLQYLGRSSGRRGVGTSEESSSRGGRGQQEVDGGTARPEGGAASQGGSGLEVSFSLAPLSTGDIAQRLENLFDPIQRDPERRANLLLEAQRRAGAASRAVETARAARPALTEKGLEIAASAGDKQAQARLDALTKLQSEQALELGGAQQEGATKDEIDQMRGKHREQRARLREKWANEEKGDQDKEKLVAWIRTLDATLSALPAEIRGKIGGYAKLASLTTDRARLEWIEDRAAKIDKEVEKFLRKDLSERFEKLLKKAEPKKDGAGKKRVGKAGADVHALFDVLREARDWAPEKAEGHAAGLESQIAAGEMTAEEEAHAMLEAGLVRQVADWKNADAARMAAALKNAEHAFMEGYASHRLHKLMQREDRQIRREAFQGDTGKAGTKAERSQRLMEEQGQRGAVTQSKRTAEKYSLAGLNFDQALRWVFGEQSTEAQRMSDDERAAANQKEDANQALAEWVDALFTRLAGGQYKGEQLSWRMAQKSMEVQGEALSEMEAISATLMWRQEDGRRHMEGVRNERNEVTSSWSYDQAFIDEIESKLSPEAKAVRSALMTEMEAEYDIINPVYRELNGIDLPRNPKYWPLTVVPQQDQAGQSIDPVTGSTMSAGSTTPGSLRTRGTSTAEPDFRDALQTFYAHKLQMHHWMAYAPFVTEARAILGNREVGNAIEAAAGNEGKSVLQGWIDSLETGGARDAAAHLALHKWGAQATSRVATMVLIGKVSVLAVQSTQLAAALAEMPTGSYLKRFSLLMTGQLDWSGAIQSDYIQRRMKQMPPIVRIAMEGLNSSKPGVRKYAARKLGETISGADALFTAGTFAMVYDYRLTLARKSGMAEADAQTLALQEAERITDNLAQPTRAGARSLMENRLTGWASRMFWGFASDARKNLALVVHAMAKRSPAEKVRAIASVWLLGSMVATLIRTAFADARDDDDDEVFDEKHWNPLRLAVATFASPLYGIPMVGGDIQQAVNAAFGIYAPSGGLFSKGSRALATVRHIDDLFRGDLTGEQIMRDVESILFLMGVFNDSAAATAALMNPVSDAVRVLQNVEGRD